MQGKCPGCGREYEISDDFVSMGGKAKCPHCVQELVFPSKDEDREKKRLLDQTRIDPNRANSTTRVEPDEVDARCPDCNRFFKVDSQYLRMGGDAKCPHCGQTLIFDVPSQPPAPKPPPDDLWSDNTSQTVELGSSPQMFEMDEPQEQAEGPDEFEVDLQHGDPYSGTGDVELPELSGLRNDEDLDHMSTEVMSAPVDDDMPTPDEDDESFIDQTQKLPRDVSVQAPSEDLDLVVGQLVTDSSELGESVSEKDDGGANLPDTDFGSGSVVGMDESLEYRDSTREMDENLAAGLIESSMQSTAMDHESDSMDSVDVDQADPLSDPGFSPEWDLSQGSELADVGDFAEDDQFSNPEEGFSEESDISGGEDLFENNDLSDDLDDLPGTSSDNQDDEVVVGILETDESQDDIDEDVIGEDGDSEDSVGREVIQSGDSEEEQGYPQEDITRDSEHGGTWGEDDAQLSLDQDSLLLLDKQQEESEVSFVGLASSEDWATAAAAWAESGFSSDQMPEFIKSEPPPDESEDFSDEEIEERDEDELPPSSTRTLKDGDSLDAMKSRGVLEDAGSVEVSDADIMEISTDEVEQVPSQVVVPGSSADDQAVSGGGQVSSMPQQPSVVRKEVSAGSMDLQGILEKLWNPPVLAGVLGVLAVLIIGLFWLLTGSDEDVQAVVFPMDHTSAEAIQAPAPDIYKAKDSAAKHYGLGNRQAYLGHFEDALDEYQKACRLDPGFPNPHRAMGAIYAALGKWKLSRTAYETYLRLAPQGPDSSQVREIIRKYNRK